MRKAFKFKPLAVSLHWLAVRKSERKLGKESFVLFVVL